MGRSADRCRSNARRRINGQETSVIIAEIVLPGDAWGKVRGVTVSVPEAGSVAYYARD